MRWPVDRPAFGSPFGMRRHPVTGVTKLHAGQDFPNNTGTVLRAVGAGRVSANLTVAQNPGGGNYIQITFPNGYKARYFHMRYQSSLRVGAIVREGDVVGYLGSTGTWTTGPHLHFEIRTPSNVAVDPVKYIRSALVTVPDGQVSNPGPSIPSAPSIPQEDTLSAAEVTQIKNFITEMTEAVDPRPRLYKHATSKQEMAVSVTQRYVRVMKNVDDRNNLIELGVISPADPIVVNDGTYRGLKAEASTPLAT